MGFGYGGIGRRTHVHRYNNITSLDVGHKHGMNGITGPTIRTGTSHVHSLNGVTTFDQGHSHNYRTVTGPAIPTRPGYHVHRYSGRVTIAGRTPHTHTFNALTAEAPDDIGY
ncbi:YmaF family protein [Desulforamulus aquiferis]|uniref:YmaF family protein n=1 Tax=Desulforamulus aquiferis TaxID=1397668 RepID=A0AAW7ZBB7_9FIRM|nr:YmaF family protein [Desulforamulus aquiferis]MDO7786583.1 YmaF family protein [Desulforamulus aquiferis]RYD05776.1 hypothetical protein N752_07740 [Desulforamulus aquiferis]